MPYVETFSTRREKRPTYLEAHVLVGISSQTTNIRLLYAQVKEFQVWVALDLKRSDLLVPLLNLALHREHQQDEEGFAKRCPEHEHFPYMA